MQTDESAGHQRWQSPAVKQKEPTGSHGNERAPACAKCIEVCWRQDVSGRKAKIGAGLLSGWYSPTHPVGFSFHNRTATRWLASHHQEAYT